MLPSICYFLFHFVHPLRCTNITSTKQMTLLLLKFYLSYGSLGQRAKWNITSIQPHREYRVLRTRAIWSQTPGCTENGRGLLYSECHLLCRTVMCALLSRTSSRTKPHNQNVILSCVELIRPIFRKRACINEVKFVFFLCVTAFSFFFFAENE